MSISEKNLSRIVSSSDAQQKELIQILHHVQEEFGFIPPEAITAVARHLKISESEIFGVLTFYRAFSLEPKGEYTVTVCMGTACHVRGGPQIVDEFERKLDLEVGQTSPDRTFSLETVNCLGCCAIGPVVVVNQEYHSNVTVKKVENIIKKYK